MGDRGPGARPKKRATTATGKRRGRPRKPLPWQVDGLSRPEKVITFIESLPVTQGFREGQTIKLLPDQRRFIETVYAEDSEIYLAIDSKPRGNGKTGLVVGLTLCHLIGPEAVPNGEVYSAALDRVTSGRLFEEILKVTNRVPWIDERVSAKLHEKKLIVMDDGGPGAGSKFIPLTADGRKANGLKATFWVFDELAQVGNPELLETLMSSLGKGQKTLGVVISTQAESDRHQLSMLIDDALSGEDPFSYAQVLSAPMDADPFDIETIRSVNPAIGHFLDERAIIAEAGKARRMPAFEPAFRNKRLNQRTDFSGDLRLFQASEWLACASAIPPIESLRGRPCFGGLDLSGKRDLTAMVLVFPTDDPVPSYDVLPYFWTPREYLNERHPKEKQLFETWIAGGYIIPQAGRVIEYSDIAAFLADIQQEFDIRQINFDPARMELLQPELDQRGVTIPFQKCHQGFFTMGPLLDLFADVVFQRRLRHGGNPVLTANVTGAVVVKDAAGGMKFDKGKSMDRSPVRIDGAVALAMALGAAQSYQPQPKKPSIAGMLRRPIMAL